MEVPQLDYRNAKYQGPVDQNYQRDGLGILIDDDLSFYASNWKSGKLNGCTLIYLAQSKYIYGQWENNEPNGLNVFRICDTVVLGMFENGKLKGRVLLIFEKINFIAILQLGENGKADVIKRGVLKNYDDLLSYIQQTNLPMKSQYFSIVKFLSLISNVNIHASPCSQSSEYYFGFETGLGMILSSNNTMLSIGVHQKKQLTEYGGKYKTGQSIEGNFQNNETVSYQNTRPTSRIHTIFNKLHKRSLNFHNDYFYSKIKILHHVQEVVRKKISEIIEEENTANISAEDLNDSLDHHTEYLQEASRINKMRQEVYQLHKGKGKNRKNDLEKSPYSTVSKNKILAPQSPIYMKKSPSKLQKTPSKSTKKANPSVYKSKTPSKNQTKQNANVGIQQQYITPKKYQYAQLPQSKQKEFLEYNFEPLCKKQDIVLKDKEENLKAHHHLQKIKGPKYEDLSERRQRILKEFKQLSCHRDKQPQMSQKIGFEKSQNLPNRELENQFMPLSLKKQGKDRLMIPKQEKVQEDYSYIPIKKKKNLETESNQKFQRVQELTPNRRKNPYKYYFD